MASDAAALRQRRVAPLDACDGSDGHDDAGLISAEATATTTTTTTTTTTMTAAAVTATPASDSAAAAAGIATAAASSRPPPLPAAPRPTADDASPVLAAAAAAATAEEIVCRICHCPAEPPAEPFIVPCRCGGSMKFVHRSCMQSWFRASHRTDVCEICNARFQYQQSFLASLRLYIAHKLGRGRDTFRNVYRALGDAFRHLTHPTRCVHPHCTVVFSLLFYVVLVLFYLWAFVIGWAMAWAPWGDLLGAMAGLDSLSYAAAVLLGHIVYLNIMERTGLRLIGFVVAYAIIIPAYFVLIQVALWQLRAVMGLVFLDRFAPAGVALPSGAGATAAIPAALGVLALQSAAIHAMYYVALDFAAFQRRRRRSVHLLDFSESRERRRRLFVRAQLSAERMVECAVRIFS